MVSVAEFGQCFGVEFNGVSLCFIGNVAVHVGVQSHR